MELGMVGLGRMGAGLVQRLQADGHTCVVTDTDPAAIEALVADGAIGASDIGALVDALTPPRAVWVMVPAAVTAPVVATVAEHLEAGDAVIDGGNNHWREAVDTAARLAERGVFHLDVGTSGGVHGRERGFCLMIGGEDEPVARLDPIFASLAPGAGSVERTPGATGDHRPAELGYLHCGPPGAGHFVKMVHNGVEYGMMAAIAEGLNVIGHAGAGRVDRGEDAETAPMSDPQYFQYDIDLADVAEVWRRGAVISSWLVDLTAAALTADPDLSGFTGRVSDSGEGRWTVQAAVDVGVPAPVIGTALFSRFASQGSDDIAGRVLSAMRKEFGGHDEKAAR